MSPARWRCSRCRKPSPRFKVTLAVLLVALATFVVIGAAGLPLLARYLLPAAALLAILGAGVAATRRGRRRARRPPALACWRRARRHGHGLAGRGRRLARSARRAGRHPHARACASAACAPLSAVTYRLVPLSPTRPAGRRRRSSRPRGPAIVIPRSARAVESLQSASDHARCCLPRRPATRSAPSRATGRSPHLQRPGASHPAAVSGRHLRLRLGFAQLEVFTADQPGLVTEPCTGARLFTRLRRTRAFSLTRRVALRERLARGSRPSAGGTVAPRGLLERQAREAARKKARATRRASAPVSRRDRRHADLDGGHPARGRGAAVARRRRHVDAGVRTARLSSQGRRRRCRPRRRCAAPTRPGREPRRPLASSARRPSALPPRRTGPSAAYFRRNQRSSYRSRQRGRRAGRRPAPDRPQLHLAGGRERHRHAESAVAFGASVLPPRPARSRSRARGARVRRAGCCRAPAGAGVVASMRAAGPAGGEAGVTGDRARGAAERHRPRRVRVARGDPGGTGGAPNGDLPAAEPGRVATIGRTAARHRSGS